MRLLVKSTILFLLLFFTSQSLLADPAIPVPKRERFEVDGKKAFVMEPPQTTRLPGPMPWVFYAPTLGNGLPGKAEHWMIHHFHQAGIAIAGVDVGESYGSPTGRQTYQRLYDLLTMKRGYSKKPVLLARSRGGLMLYNWAAEHPDAVGGIAGIYPVCNLKSYPGLKRAAPAYKLTEQQLLEQLDEHNPISRITPLAKAGVPIMHIHGDSDRVVPLEANSAELARQYRRQGGPVHIEVIPGQGHNMWKGWFESKKLTDFVIAHATGKPFPSEK